MAGHQAMRRSRSASGKSYYEKGFFNQNFFEPGKQDNV